MPDATLDATTGTTSTATSLATSPATRISHSASLYVRQHAGHRVQWNLWNVNAFERARAEGKPVLLSLGCIESAESHQMTQEHFENPEIADFLNAHYVCIKVDRDERPDLDAIYQPVAFAMVRRMGYPLTIFLTAEGKPFYGGLGFSKNRAPDRTQSGPDFLQLLLTLFDLYKNEPQTVNESAERLIAYLRALDRERTFDPPGATSRVETLDRGLGTALRAAADRWMADFDGDNGSEPETPSKLSLPALSFLWRMGVAVDWEEPCDAVTQTLENIALGDIFDATQGGFYRCKVAGIQSTPRRHKALVDQALTLRLFSEVLLTPGQYGSLTSVVESVHADRRSLYLDTVSKSAEFVLQQMRSPQGLFYHSVTGGVSSGTSGGKSSDSLAKDTIVDTRLTTASNALMVSALASVAAALRVWGAPGSTHLDLAHRADQAARSAFEGLLTLARKNSNEEDRRDEAEIGIRLSAEVKNNDQSADFFEGFLDDYAFTAQAAIDLIRFSGASERAETLAQALPIATGCIDAILNYFDSPEPGWHFTRSNSDRGLVLIHRPKSIHDHEVPSGTAIALQVLLWLSAMGTVHAEYYAREVDLQLTSLQNRSFAETSGRAGLMSAYLLRSLGPCVARGVPEAASLYGWFNVMTLPASATTDAALICHRGLRREVSVPDGDGVAQAWIDHVLPSTHLAY